MHCVRLTPCILDVCKWQGMQQGMHMQQMQQMQQMQMGGYMQQVACLELADICVLGILVTRSCGKVMGRKKG
eukprot:1172276-Amphidinium_carterae.1